MTSRSACWPKADVDRPFAPGVKAISRGSPRSCGSALNGQTRGLGSKAKVELPLAGDLSELV
jgi:hypothetical protein